MGAFMKKDSRVTGHQLAAMLGVSQPTVSRALRGDVRVNEQTRVRIADLARELNYAVDHNALRLRTRQTNTIALVVLCRSGENRANINPFYLALLGCIAASAADRGYSLIVSFQDGPHNFCANYVASGQADGLIVIGSGQNVDGWRFFAEQAARQVPMVCWGASKEDLISIKSDNAQGATLAVEHLLARGCRAIAYIGPTNSEQPQFQERVATYHSIAHERGLPVICPPLPENAVREDQGYAATRSLLNDGVAFDGLFAANDFIALGAMRALAEHGLKVGSDVRVVGFDGIATGAYSQPPLTTIEQDYRRAGENLVEGLIAALADEDVVLAPVPVRLLERASS
jgi:DNA-binding LacI/PurR family transcriptional regulator